LRLRTPRPYFFDLLDPGVRGAVDQAIGRLRAAGAVVEDAAVRDVDLIAPAYLLIVLAEAAALHASSLERQPLDYTPNVRQRLELGRYVLAEDYVRAREARRALTANVDLALEGCDALLLPTLPIPAPRLGAASVVVDGRRESVRNIMLRLTQLFNMTGRPALTLPCGTTPEGLPCGLQIVGPNSDGVLAVALACERALRA
jgi:aspartyl-tRNA(Asn)/glutamyl-tRNA(Gln) amidotransferase subunit A